MTKARGKPRAFLRLGIFLLLFAKGYGESPRIAPGAILVSLRIFSRGSWQPEITIVL